MLIHAGRVGSRGLRSAVVLTPPTLSYDFTAGALPAPFTLVRATKGTSCNAVGVWSEVAVNAARFDGTNGLLIEAARTNSIRNPRCEGATPGTPGTPPTNWNLNFQAAGATAQLMGTGTEFGLPYVEYRITGTTAGAGNLDFNLDTASGVAALNTQVWTVSAYLRVTAGGYTGLNGLSVGMQELTNVGGFLAFSSGAASTVYDTTLRRATHTRTLNQATTANLQPVMRLNTQAGIAFNITFRLYAPQLEQGAFATTPILPTAGTPAASTRNADIVTATLAALSLPVSGRGTYRYTQAFYGLEPTLNATPFHVDDGTNSNRYMVYLPGGFTEEFLSRRTAGATLSIDFAALIANGTPYTQAISIIGDGNAFASQGGAVAGTVAGGPTAGLTTLRLGNDASPGASITGVVKNLSIWATPIPGAGLPAYSA